MDWIAPEPVRDGDCRCPDRFRGELGVVARVPKGTKCWVKRQGEKEWHPYTTTRDLAFKKSQRIRSYIFTSDGWLIRLWKPRGSA